MLLAADVPERYTMLHTTLVGSTSMNRLSTLYEYVLLGNILPESNKLYNSSSIRV